MSSRKGKWQPKSNQQQIRIQGEVVPHEKDWHNSVLQVAIVTDDFETYIILDDPMGEELIEMVGSYVEVVGVIFGEDYSGNKVVCARRFRPMSNQSESA